MELARLNDPTLSIVKTAAGTATSEATVISRDGNPMPLVVSGAGGGLLRPVWLADDAGSDLHP